MLRIVDSAHPNPPGITTNRFLPCCQMARFFVMQVIGVLQTMAVVSPNTAPNVPVVCGYGGGDWAFRISS